jgi:tetratricopeptide (TPR) repeat protein
MEAGKSSSVVKWVGLLTAILALFTGIRQVVKMVSDRAEAARKVDALLASEELQLQGRDYRLAWRSLEQAAQIDSDSVKVQAAQEKLAMEWLENISKPENEKFSDITEKLEPILVRGVTASKSGPRKADLLAHIGWSYFLRTRDGALDLDPAGKYASAVQEDKTNPFAQAMWGHWILWNGGKLDDAEQHFASALTSNREGDYIRNLQLSALFNCHKDECEEEVIRVVTDMRKARRTVNSDTQNRIFSTYYSRLLLDRADSSSFVNAVPPAEHLATFHWLFDKADLDESKSTLRTYYVAALQEAAGQHDDALAGFRVIHTQVAGHSGSLKDAADAGIQRLSHSQPVGKR